MNLNKKALMLFLILLFAVSIFSACSENPVTTDVIKAPKTTAGASQQIPEISLPDNQSGIVTTEKRPSETIPQIDIEFPLEISDEKTDSWTKGHNPYYDKQSKSFSCYFTNDYIYTFENGDKCTFTITDESGSVHSAGGVVDLTLGGSNFTEEGLFIGVCVTCDFAFQSGSSYSVNVKAETKNYVYTFRFEFTAE